MKQAFLATLAMLIVGSTVLAQAVQPETKEERDRRMAWFRDARFGMFIHWGLYAIPAGEWEGKRIGGAGEWILNSGKLPIQDYEKLKDRFNPVKFDARAWVAIAKNAGVKYIVITSKHHDGFCLWDSKVSDYTVAHTPFHRDILKELSDACHEAGIQMCFYHSIMDWHHPDAQRVGYNDAKHNPNFQRYVQTYLRPQLKELLTNYGHIGILWFDGEWIGDWTDQNGPETYAYIRSLQPDLIVNNRVGKGRSGMQGMSAGKGAAGDYGTPEQEIPATGFPGLDWETCMTMNDTWGFVKTDHNWKSPTTLIRMLIETSSKGGNFLLNVGPTAEGLIPEASVDRLSAIGAWMKVNSESIYGTSASPFKKLAFGRATQKPGKLFLHVYTWPKDGGLLVPISNKVSKAYLLTDREKALDVVSAEGGVSIKVPAQMPDPIATVVALEIEGQAQVIANSAIKADAKGAFTLKAADAEPSGQARLETKGGTECIGYWTDPADTVRWEIQIDKPGAYSVEVRYALDSGSGGSAADVVVGQSKLSLSLTATGSWDQFKAIKPGQIRIEKAGVNTIVIQPTKKPGQGVMNLANITLTPVP